MKFIIVLTLFIGASLAATTSNTSPKIVGGRDAVENEFPYVVSLRRSELEIILGQPYHVCGGTIIGLDTVFTASHCLFDSFGNALTQPGSYIVVAGLLRMWSDDGSGKNFGVSEIFGHPSYDPDTFDNDIAILKVTPSFVFNLPNIQPIRIDFNQTLIEDTKCSVHGWGVLAWNSNQIPDVLQTVELSISNFSQCNATYDNGLTSNQFCGYETDKDSCSGDSGGPLVCNNQLVGIVSFGFECAVPDVPGVYTKVAAFSDFIENYRNYFSKNSSSASIKSLKCIYFMVLCSVMILMK